MRTKKDFSLREVCGEIILIAEGEKNIDFSEIISLNETSAYLWGIAEGKDFDANSLATALYEKYDVDFNVALADVNRMIEAWREAKLLEEDI